MGAGVAGVTTVGLLVVRRRDGLPVGYLALAAAGAVPWCLSVALAVTEGPHPWHQSLWMPAVAWTAGSLLLWALGFSRYGWEPSRGLVALCLGTPVVLLLVRVVIGPESKAAIFVFNTFYAFLLLLVVAASASRRSRDPNPAVRMVSYAVVVGAVLALMAEALRVQVTDLAATAGLAAMAVATARAGADALARPEAELLLDDLGALVLVFDEDQRLVDLNAPARLFYSLRETDPPAAGTDAQAILHAGLDELDTVSTDLLAGQHRVAVAGYVQRLPLGGTPPRGWVVLLRPRAGRTSPLDRRAARRAALSLVDGDGQPAG